MKKIIITTSVVASLALSATPPKIGDIQKEVVAPKIEQTQKQLPILKDLAPMKELDLKDGEKVFIKDITLLNANTLDKTTLENITKEYKQKELSFKAMQELALKLTKAYRAQGYFVAKAYIPKQDIKQQNNTLTINVIEGQYDSMEVVNNSFVKDSILKDRLEHIKQAKVINAEAIERGLLNINSLSGVSVKKIDIKPGSKIGTSSFLVEFDKTKKYDGYIIGDNHGSKYTEKYRALLGVNVNSLLNIGDKLSFDGMISKGNGLKSGSLDYSFPLYKNGLNASIGYSNVDYKLGDIYKSLDAVGESDTFNFKLSYPYIQTRTQTLNLYGKYENKDMKDEIRSTSDITEKTADIFRVGATYTNNSILFDKSNSFSIDTYLTRGNLKFKDDAKKTADENGAQTNGNFSKINISIDNTLFINEHYSLDTDIQLQRTFGKNLDGSEDISLGGANGVRVYPSSESSAENGYLVKNELYYTLPTYYTLNSKVGLFHEIGKVNTYKNVTDFESRTLQDIGVSYKGSYKDMFFDMSYARKVGAAKVTSESDYSSKFLFQFGYLF